MTGGAPHLNIVHLAFMPIFEQLQREEALLRAGTGNWCLFNHGTPPAIVMGLTGSREETVVAQARIPIIRRFSGGGTVVVDEDTVFFTLIMDRDSLPCLNNPSDVMTWTGWLLSPAFAPYTLTVEGQDYAINGKKVGGNAQAFSCGRVLHHTSFLWAWDKKRMDLLKMPLRQPDYRKERDHADFCMSLSNVFPTKSHLVDALEERLHNFFECKTVLRSQIDEFLHKPHRKALQSI